VIPLRTESGYRLYDDQMIATLRAMRALIGAGWSAAQAAQGILSRELPVEEWAEHPPPAPTEGLQARPGSIQDPVAVLVDAAAVYDGATVEAALDEMFSRGSFETIVDDLVMPAAVALGEAWAAGRVEVAAEHMASAAIGRRLAMAYGAASRPSDAPQVIVGLPPGSRHELGALAFAITLRRRAIGVLYLGADVPIDSWVDVVRRSSVRAAVVAVVTEADVRAAAEVVSAIESADQGIVVALGGSRAAMVDRSDRTIVLETRWLTTAAEELARALADR